MIEVKAMLRMERKLIYAALALIVVLLVLLLVVFSRVLTVSENVISVAQTASKNTTAIAEIKANQDLYRQQYLNYIKDLISTMNKLQADNADPEVVKKRGVKVPKMPVLRTPLEKINEADLERIPQTLPVAGPSPTPIVKTQTKTVIKYKKPKPTPLPKTDIRTWFRSTR